MPPVIIGVAVAAVASIGFGATLAVALAVGMAAASAYMAATMKVPSMSDYASQQERKQVLRAAAGPAVAVYGKTVSSGTLIFAEEQPGEQDDGEWIHIAIAIAGHKIGGIGTVWLGDETTEQLGFITSAAEQIPLSANSWIYAIAKAAIDIAEYELHNDRQTCDPVMLEKCPSWHDDMIGKSMAWLRLSLKFNAEKFPAGLPNIKMEKFGALIYDPRDGVTKWTDNAALVILDYYRTWLQAPDSEINWDEFELAANICDESVTRPDSTTERRYTINGEFDLSEPPAKILDAMHKACGGDPTYSGGKHGIIVGAYYGPATAEIYDWQLAGDVQIVPETAQRDRTNTITGRFVDAGQQYTEADFPPVSVAAWVSEDGGEITDDLDLRFVTSDYQAQRLANIQLRRKRLGRTITLPLNFSGFGYRPGLPVKLYLPALGISGAEFRVIRWDFGVSNGVKLTLREESSSVYDDAIGQVMERPPLTTLSVGGPAMPDNLQYSTETIGEVVQGVLTWSNQGAQIAYNSVVVTSAGVTVLTAQVPGQLCRLSGLPAGDYSAQVRAVALNGAKSLPATVAFTIALPVEPVLVEIRAANWSIELIPRWAGANTVGTLCEFWGAAALLTLGQVEAQATLLGVGASLSHTGLQPDTIYYYWVRAVNAYGKSGWYSLEARTSYDPASVIAILDNQIGAELLRDELRTQIELIPQLASRLPQVDGLVEELTERVDQARLRIDEAQQRTEIEFEGAYAAITDLSEVVADETQARVALGELVDVRYQDNEASLLSMQEAIADGDAALANDINALQVAVGDNAALIADEATARASADGSLAERIGVIEADYTGSGTTLTEATTRIAAEETARANAISAHAQRMDNIDAGWMQGDIDNTALIADEATARSDADSAMANRISAIEADYSSAGTTLTQANARIAAEEAARADAISAHAQRMDNIDAGWAQGDIDNAALVAAEAQARADAVSAVAENVTTVSATANAAKGVTDKMIKLWATSGGFGGGPSVIYDKLDNDNVLATAGRSWHLLVLSRADYSVMHSQTYDVFGDPANAQALADKLNSYAIGSAFFIAFTYDEPSQNLTPNLKAALVNAGATYSALDAIGYRSAYILSGIPGVGEGWGDEYLDPDDGGRIETMLSFTAGLPDNGRAGATAAVRTIAKASASTQGELTALWATKAQVGDAMAGFGMEITLSQDGTALSSFVIDCDVFAVLSRALGAGSTTHPFVVKNGTVYINHAMIETAEINTVISDYIQTTKLSGYLIEGVQIRGGDLGVGPGGPNNGYHTWVGSDGKIYSDYIKATGGEFTGKVTANDGSFSNVVINESCEIKRVYAEKIYGDVGAVKSFHINQATLGGTTTLFSFNIYSSPLVRVVDIGLIRLAGRDVSNPSGYIKVYMDGGMVFSQLVPAEYSSLVDPPVIEISAGISHTCVVKLEMSNSTLMVFEQDVVVRINPKSSSTFY